MKMRMNRRYCIAFLSGLSVTVAMATNRSSPTGTLLVLGDSLSAEYGLRRGSGWVALLEKKLQHEKKALHVVNASISGETSAGGKSRLQALLRQHQPRWVVLELGANDALRGLSLDMTTEHLSAMIRMAQQAGARVVLVGMQVPPNYGAAYARQFSAIFPQLAKQHRTALVPFLLDGIANVPDSMRWFQADRIHPAESAQEKMLANVWRALGPLIR